MQFFLLNKKEYAFFIHLESFSEDYLVRKIDAVIDVDFIYRAVEKLHSENTGRPSIDLVLLIKMALLQYVFGILSMRRTIKEIETNMAYRTVGF
ncbi:hypothetical protein A0126_18900 (plasmid) [Exiguobacterium sp. N4-1P]|nr:hypothetical protein A0126_15220 [Exiguobacterium sp. N4-1P]ASI37656.1 hypothetical protein A0126_18900 [Exiguobacterium sp. N4-1P]